MSSTLRLIHQHLLEAALQRRILLDVLAVFIQRRCAHAVQLAARQRGLEHVARVHGALGLAGADHGVQLVDEQDDLSFLLGEVLEHRLQALLELAAELGASDQCAHIQGEDALVLQALGTSPLTMRCASPSTMAVLPTPGSPISTGLFLVLPLQDLDGAADLVVATDHRVELAAAGALGQVHRVFAQGLAALLGIGVVDRLATTHLLDGLLDLGLGGPHGLEQLAQFAPILQRRHGKQLAEMYWSPRCWASLSVTLRRRERSCETCTSPGVPSTLGRRSSSAESSVLSFGTFTPALPSSGRKVPPCWSRSAANRCAGSIIWLSRPTASDWASAKAVWNRLVSLSLRMRAFWGRLPLYQ